jgi:HEPN domain-containing protein
LSEKLALEPPPEVFDCLYLLNRTSVPTRYPDELRDLAAVYDRVKTERMLADCRGVLLWLKKQLPG